MSSATSPIKTASSLSSYMTHGGNAEILWRLKITDDKISQVLHVQGINDAEKLNNLLPQFKNDLVIYDAFVRLKNAAIAKYPHYFSKKIGNINDKTGMFN